MVVYYYCKCEIYECNFDNANKTTTDCNDYTLTELINENNISNDSSYIKIIESYNEIFRITDFSSISKRH